MTKRLSHIPQTTLILLSIAGVFMLWGCGGSNEKTSVSVRYFEDPDPIETPSAQPPENARIVIPEDESEKIPDTEAPLLFPESEKIPPEVAKELMKKRRQQTTETSAEEESGETPAIELEEESSETAMPAEDIKEQASEAAEPATKEKPGQEPEPSTPAPLKVKQSLDSRTTLKNTNTKPVQAKPKAAAPETPVLPEPPKVVTPSQKPTPKSEPMELPPPPQKNTPAQPQ